MSLYAHQGELPSLPVPPLEDTLAKFLKSARPFLSAEVRGATEGQERFQG